MLKLLSKISPTFLGYRKERIKDFLNVMGSNEDINVCILIPHFTDHVGGGNLGQSLNIYYYFPKKKHISKMT